MSIIQQCPHCGNHVEGKRIQSYSKKVAKTSVKGVVNGMASAAAKGTGAIIGTAFSPGIGTAIGVGLGGLVSKMYQPAVNDGIDAVADVVTEAEYEFTCPKCGHTWTGQEDNDDSYNYDVAKIKRIIAQTLVGVGYDEVVPKASLKKLGADDLDVVEICMELESEFGIDIPEGTIDESSYVEDLIEYITGESISDGDIEPSYNGLPDDSSITDAEQEYLNSIREFLEDEAEISPRERKMLNRIRQSLGISEERAKELEASLNPQLTEDEQEYLDMYHEYAEKGELTEKERRRLDKFAAAMGISAERVKEIEKV